MSEPTQEQIKEFWEWCGFRYKESDGPLACYWETSNGRTWGYKLPRVDLNNLFKYAVPKLDQSRYYKALSSIFYYDAIKDDPALALFWALWAVMTRDKKQTKKHIETNIPSTEIQTEDLQDDAELLGGR